MKTKTLGKASYVLLFLLALILTYALVTFPINIVYTTFLGCNIILTLTIIKKLEDLGYLDF